MEALERITLEPGKRSGKTCIRGLRVTVYEVLSLLSTDVSEVELLQDFMISTRNSDVGNMTALYDPLPKVLYLRIGNYRWQQMAANQ